MTGASASSDHDLGPEPPPVAAAQHLVLGALDVDLEKVDGAGACCSHSARSVMTGMVMACERLPNSLLRRAGMASTVVESPWKSSTR